MKRLFDTSVLISVFYANHAKHAVSASAFLAARKQDSFCALRTLGEMYAVLTRLPLRPRITGPDAIAILQQIRQRLTVVPLNEEEYFSAIEAASPNIIGGATYDALIAQCAIKVGADVLLTWNVHDFKRFDKVAHLVKTPDELQAENLA